MPAMKTLRIFFKKTGRAAYISHLDLSRTMQRAIKRAGLPVWYTEGYNPHIYLTFALPLSLGFWGLQESMDLRVVEDIDSETVIARLNATLPEGLEATAAVTEPAMKPSLITFAQYELALNIPGCDELQPALDRFLAQPVIEVKKHSKKGERIIDLKPDIDIHRLAIDGHNVSIEIVLPAGGERNINPTLLIDALTAFLDTGIDVVNVTRTAIYDKNMDSFAG